MLTATLLFAFWADRGGQSVRQPESNRADSPCDDHAVQSDWCFGAERVFGDRQDQDDFIVMPFTTAEKRITGSFWLDDIFCSAVSREAMPEATRQITALLRERHHLNASRMTISTSGGRKMSCRRNWQRAGS